MNMAEITEDDSRHDDAAEVDESAVRAEVSAVDVGTLPRSDAEASLYRYVRAKAQLQDEIARVKAGAASMIAALERRIAGLDFVYRQEVIHTVKSMLRGKARSVKTPYGVAGFRKCGGGVTVTDPEALLTAVVNGSLPPALRREKVEVNKAAVNDLYKKTGELPIGCEPIPEGEEFYVK